MGSVLELVPEVTVTTLYQVPLQLAKPSVNSEPKKKKKNFLKIQTQSLRDTR